MPRPPRGHPYACGPYKHRRRFRLKIYTGARTERGTRAVRHQYFDTESAAKAWQREFHRQVAAAGRDVGDLIEAWLAWCLRKGQKQRSVVTLGFRLRALFDEKMPLASLTPPRAQELYDRLVDTPGRRGKPPAADTHQACLVQARAMCNWGVTQGWLRTNPFAKVEPVGRKKRRKAQLRRDEARLFYRHCLEAWARSKDRSAIAALLPFVMNLRASEVGALHAEHVDDRGRVLLVAEGEDVATGEDRGKSEAAQRQLSIPAPLRPIMLEIAALAGPGGALFTKRDGRAADRHRVADWCEQHLRAAGVTRRVTTHGLRGTHSTVSREEGRSPEDIARAMGHTSSSMTERHYIEEGASRDADIDRLMEVLEDEDGETGGDG
jgi:integrase